MEVDHDLVVVDEFDALAIEVKVSPKQGQTSPSSPPPSSSAAAAATASGSTPSLSQPTTPLSERESFLAQEKAKLRQQLEELGKKLGKFPAKQHARKVAAELGVDNGLIYLPGQEELAYEDSDMDFEFRQRRYFYYLSGADFAGCQVSYDIARDHLILWISQVEPKKVLWYGFTPSAEECLRRSDVSEVRVGGPGLQRYLFMTMQPGSTMYILHADQAPRMDNTKGMVTINATHLRPAMDAARVVKSDYEVAMIRRANVISSAAHRAVLPRLRRLQNERELDAIFRGFCLAQGARRQAYPVIAGAGTNAATLHYWQNDAPLAGKQLLVLDAGAEFDCYASDITRTLPLNGKFSPEAAAIYSVVERMQEECIAKIKPGLFYFTLHLHACLVAVTELLKLGILHHGTATEIFARGTVAAFFPHGLGHHVGLEVHDVSGREKLLLGTSVSTGTASFERARARRGGSATGVRAGKREWISPETLSAMYRDAAMNPPPYAGRQKLEKNMVVTVEPGIYFCREYIKAYFLDNPLHAKYINAAALEKYYPVGGVRIEDCILVTDDGYENLTLAPKGEEALKIINSGQ